MKKLNKALSLILAFAMVIPGIPIVANAAPSPQTLLTENFDYSDTAITSPASTIGALSQYVYLEYNTNNAKVVSNELVLTGTASVVVNAKKLFPGEIVPDKGYLTYKFTYNQTVNKNVAMKLNVPANKTTGGFDTTLRLAKAGRPVDASFTVDLENHKVIYSESGAMPVEKTISTQYQNLQGYGLFGIRGTIGTTGDTLKIDNLKVIYSKTPVEKTGILDFETPSQWSGVLESPWTAITLSDKSVAPQGKVLSSTHSSTGLCGFHTAMTWTNSGAGKMTYEFDVHANGTNLAFATDKLDTYNDTKRVGMLTGTDFRMWPGGTYTSVTNGVNANDWNHIKIEFDLTNKLVTIWCNDIQLHDAFAFPSGVTTSNAMCLTLRASSATAGNIPEIYIDNFKATYVEAVPEVGEVAHTWLGGVTVPFSMAMDEASVEGGITVKDTTADADVVVNTDYNTATKVATVVPATAFTPGHSYVLTVDEYVKGTNNVYIGEDVSKPITLESLSDPAVEDGDITVFDKNDATPPISRIKKIKAKFNVPMDEASLETDGNVTLYKEGEATPITISVVYDMNDDNSVVVTSSTELDPNNRYILTFTTNVKRIDGVNLTSPIVKNIDTPVLEQPKLVAEGVTYTDKSGVTDKVNVVKKKVTNINIPFDIPLKSETVTNTNITFVKLTGGESPVGFGASYNEGSKTVTVTPTVALDPECEYKITFTSNIKATNDEEVNPDYDEISFETAALDRTVILKIEGTSDGSNYAAAEGVADINELRAEFSYKLKAATATAANIKLEKYNGTDWVDAGATFGFDGNKTVTFSLAANATYPEGTDFRIRCTSAVEDICDDGMTADASDYTKTFATKQSAIVRDLSCVMNGKTLTYSGKLVSGATPIGGEKMSMLIYKQGGAAVPFGADTRYFTILTTNTDGSFGGEIDIYDAESTPIFEELWVAFDAQSMGKSNQRDSKMAIQYTNGKMDEASIADLKASGKDVFTYITEAADSATMSGLVPANGLSAMQNKKLYKSMGVWVDKYSAMTAGEKAATNTSLAGYKAGLTTSNAAKVLNASLIAADYISLDTTSAVDDLTLYNDTIEEIKVETTDFSGLSDESKAWVAENVKANNPTGFDNYEVFTKEVKKSMLVDMVSTTTYTELKELFVNNKDLVNDGLGENKLATLEGETREAVIDSAMQAIKLQNDSNKFATTSALAGAIKTAVDNAIATANSQGTNTGGTKNDGFSIGGGGGGGGTTTIKPDDKVDPKPEVKPEVKPDEDTKPSNEVFIDLSGFEWAKTAIMNLYNMGIVSGTGESSYEPSRAVTREEFVKLICEAFDFDISDGASSFEDVDADAWYTKYVAGAVKLGIINGVSDKHFGTGQMITREDMAVMIIRALTASGRATNAERKSFADESEISDYALDAVEALGGMGIINGVGDDNYAPKNNATRAEAAVIINRCLQ